MATLDHIVLLVPAAVLEALPAWLTAAFSVVDGGQHAGGATANRLLLLADGVYVELIAFVGGRTGHRWGAEPEGRIIDWALSLVEDEDGGGASTEAAFRQIQSRVRAAGAGLVYGDLVPGGRTTPDGTVLQWATAAPADGDAAVVGTLPFWCLDRTPRRLRVPFADGGGAQARHPSGAVGVAGLTLHVADAALRARLRAVYDVILGRGEQQAQALDAWTWTLPVPAPGPHGRLPRLRLEGGEGGGPDAWMELALFTTGPPGTVGGHFVDGWRVTVQLQAVSQ